MLDRRLRWFAFALALIGLAVTIYLTYEHYAGGKVACGVTAGCDEVQNSKYAMLLGIPLSLFGIISYAGILVALLVDGEHGRIGAAFLALVGLGFSLYLLYREIFTIEAFCQWCMISLAVMTMLTAITIWRLLRAPLPAASAPGDESHGGGAAT